MVKHSASIKQLKKKHQSAKKYVPPQKSKFTLNELKEVVEDVLSNLDTYGHGRASNMIKRLKNDLAQFINIGLSYSEYRNIVNRMDNAFLKALKKQTRSRSRSGSRSRSRTGSRSNSAKHNVPASMRVNNGIYKGVVVSGGYTSPVKRRAPRKSPSTRSKQLKTQWTKKNTQVKELKKELSTLQSKYKYIEDRVRNNQHVTEKNYVEQTQLPKEINKIQQKLDKAESQEFEILRKMNSISPTKKPKQVVKSAKRSPRQSANTKLKNMKSLLHDLESELKTVINQFPEKDSNRKRQRFLEFANANPIWKDKYIQRQKLKSDIKKLTDLIATRSSKPRKPRSRKTPTAPINNANYQSVEFIEDSDELLKS